MFTVEASDGLRTEFIRCRNLCRAIRRFEIVIMEGNVCEVTILDSRENELIVWER